MLARLVAILVLVLLNGFFVAAGFALVRARRPRLEAMAREGDRLARFALRASASTGTILSASQLGGTLASLALGWVLAAWFARPVAPGGALAASLRFIIGAAVVIYLHIVVGQLTPRAVALAQPERLARWLALPLLAFAWITRPVTATLAGSIQLVGRWIRRRTPPDEANVHSPDELRLLVERSQEEGVLEPQDADLLEGVFEFSEKAAREVMTPRTEIVALPVEATLPQTLALVEESALSRYPVYDGSIDNIVGMVLAKDLIGVVAHPAPDFALRTVTRAVHVIPGTRLVEDVLADFKRLKEHLAVVVDEYGGTAGIVTMEDLLEEIVGEILDEYDELEVPALPERPGEILVGGEMSIDALNEEYGLGVPDADYTTIGGFIFGTLGRLPVIGDTVTAGGAVFTVREMAARRVETLAVEPRSISAET